MKRKALALFLMTVLMGTMISGCGNAPAEENETAAETQEGKS